MSTRKWLVVAVVVVGLALFVFGRETLSYLAGAREFTEGAVKERIPTEFEIARIETMLTKLDSVIEKRRSALVDMQLQSEALEKEIQNRRKDLARISHKRAEK